MPSSWVDDFTTDNFAGGAMYTAPYGSPTVGGGTATVASLSLWADQRSPLTVPFEFELDMTAVPDGSDVLVGALTADFSEGVLGGVEGPSGVMSAVASGASPYSAAPAITPPSGAYVIKVSLDESGLFTLDVGGQTASTTLPSDLMAAISGVDLYPGCGVVAPYGPVAMSGWSYGPAGGGGGGGVPEAPLVLTDQGLVFSITSLRYPGLEPVRLRRLVQYTDGSVTIPLNGQRAAAVTISVYDPACLDALPLERFLFVRLYGVPIFWGPITTPDWDLANGTVTINALGPDYRLVKHFLVVGDAIGSSTIPTPVPGGTAGVPCPVSAGGLWDLVYAAYNDAGQTARGVPDLGIIQGVTGDQESSHEVDVQRGDCVMDDIANVASDIEGPDFDFIPQELDEGSYAHLDTWGKRGTDKSSGVGAVQFHFGWGKDNLDDYEYQPGGDSVITHDHVISSDGLNAGTAAAAGPSARFGPYVNWDALDINPAGATDDIKNEVLAAFGRGTVMAYGEPIKSLTLTLKTTVNSDQTLPRYLHDFDVGDVVDTHGRRGYFDLHTPARIVSVTLSQAAASKSVVPSLEVVPAILTSADVDSTES